MKYFILVISLIIVSFSAHSQEKKYDIFILLENDVNQKITGIQNDTLVFQVFNLKTQLHSSSKEYIINDKGTLETKIKIKGSNGTDLIRLSYKNVNNSNLPFILNKDVSKNLLKYPSDFFGSKFENIYNLLNKSTNIYIIESNFNYGYYLVKKVELN